MCIRDRAYDYEGHSYSWSRVYGGSDGSFVNESDFAMGYLNARYTISPLSYIKASLSQQTYETTSGNENYLNNIEEYGRRTKAWGSANYYKRDRTGFNPVAPDEFFGVSGYGSQYTSFDTRKTSFDFSLVLLKNIAIASAADVASSSNEALEIGKPVRSETIV